MDNLVNEFPFALPHKHQSVCIPLVCSQGDWDSQAISCPNFFVCFWIFIIGVTIFLKLSMSHAIQIFTVSWNLYLIITVIQNKTRKLCMRSSWFDVSRRYQGIWAPPRLGKAFGQCNWFTCLTNFNQLDPWHSWSVPPSHVAWLSCWRPIWWSEQTCERWCPNLSNNLSVSPISKQGNDISYGGEHSW